jgi:hypothetical protein
MKLLIAGVTALMLIAAPAAAQSNICRPYDEYRHAIESQGGERLSIRGESVVYGPRGIDRAEIYINPETKSLSYMFVRIEPDGSETMCLGDFLPEFEFVPAAETVPQGDPT